ncbi:YraN family protein [Flagellimonas sp. S174]|uniref:YraN family protein n=1 Tax=Flagellimonas sp. S174 TaxID=3410790 RepID=UPI0026037716|nr:YraN family protein [uncultured Allomuricauda sp.]
MGQHNAFGHEGERIAADFLMKKGYQILKQNYRYDRAEIDILAQNEDTLIVVEVKSRTSEFLEDITQVINQGKIKRLVKAADHYVEENNLDLEVRFDVIIVKRSSKGMEIEHLESAFHHF